MWHRQAGQRRQRGFTVMEVMVAAVIAFLLSAIAISAYQGYLQTARQEAIMTKVSAFKVFMDNYRVDTGAYMPGNYAPGGTNDFVVTGYRMRGDESDGISFRVEAGSCGAIANCYRVVATNTQGETGTFEASTGTWSW